MDLIEKAAVGDDQDTATLMNLVMQFRKVCNHPDLFERAETSSPFALAHYAETASFLREGNNVNVAYSTRNLIEYDLPRLLCTPAGGLDAAGPTNTKAGFRGRYLTELMNIWTPENIQKSSTGNAAFLDAFCRHVGWRSICGVTQRRGRTSVATCRQGSLPCEVKSCVR